MIRMLAAATLLASLSPSVAAQEVTQLPARDRAVTLHAEPLHSIGGINADDWQLFGEDVQVGFDQEGLLHVLDADNFRILAVNESGELVWEAGSEGGGPGEFGLPMSLAVAPDGSTTVYDLAHQAMVQFGPEGTYLDQIPHGMDLGIPGREMLADPSGGVVFSGAGAIAMRRDASGTTMTQGGGERTPIRRALAGGRDGVAYNAWRLPAMPIEPASMGSGRSFSMPAMRAFEPELFYAPLTDNRLVVVDTVDYAVKVVGSDGTVERVIRRPIEPREVGRAEREAEKKRQLDALKERGAPQARVIMRGGSGGGGVQTPNQGAMREMLEGRLENMEFADHIPVIDAMRVDPWTGQIWIRRTGRRVGDDGPIDVLTADGAYLGTLSADERMPAAFGPDGLVVHRVTDEFDVTSLEVARITGLR